jgi:hypothetical protein
MKTKKTTTKKSKSYWDHLMAKPTPHKAAPKHKAAHKPQPKATTMTKKAEKTEEEQEEFLPPPDPPAVPSEPRDPPEPLEVDDSEKGADPEVEAERELNITPGSTPGEGPRPEEPEGAEEPEPEEPEPEERKKK